MAGKSKPVKTLAEQIAELEDPAPKDFDPEDLEYGHTSDGDEEIGNVLDDAAGREHYEAVGKGRLRQQDPVSLGKQYAGSRISRDALDADSDDDDDPFKARFSEEDDEEEDLDDGHNDSAGIDEFGDGRGSRTGDTVGSDDDEEEVASSVSSPAIESAVDLRRRKGSNSVRPSKQQPQSRLSRNEMIVDSMDTDGSEGQEEEFISDMSDNLEDGTEFSDEDEDGSEFSDEEDGSEDGVIATKLEKSTENRNRTEDREELRKLMATDQKTIAATISQAAKADAAKGKAVKQQRATFDALLNTRIKLQKGMTLINELAVGSIESETVDEEAVKSAESAALTLWSTLEDLRLALADAHTTDESKKRKRPAPATPTASTASLWVRMAQLEADAVKHRRAILDKWSLKVRGVTGSLPNARGKLLGAGSGQQNLTAVLDAHVATENGERAAKRSRPAGSTQSDHESIYDDTAFYQSLLRDLVEQRMSSSDAITNGLDTLHLQNLPSRLSLHPVTGMRKDKVKKDVDTRASKGRKMKFNVHEKLQNFMAPEDRGSWTVRAREEFFASLLGKTASGLLGEGDDEVVSDAENSADDGGREEVGLKLFRS